MSTDQLNIYTSETDIIVDCVSEYDSLHSEFKIKPSEELIFSAHKQVPDRYYISVLFHTNEGYRTGNIISYNNNKTCEVLFTRDEFGNLINDRTTIPLSSIVKPFRKNHGQVSIKVAPIIIAEGYVRAGQPIEIGCGIGSGVNSISVPSSPSKHKKKITESRVSEYTLYPIYKPLTFHSLQQRSTLTYGSYFLLQLIDYYLKTGNILMEMLDQANWLINVVLFIDNHSLIPKNVMLEAIINFCFDYTNLSSGSFIRQPINYIFDIIGIDGVYSKSQQSISYISLDFEGVTYTSLIDE